METSTTSYLFVVILVVLAIVAVRSVRRKRIDDAKRDGRRIRKEWQYERLGLKRKRKHGKERFISLYGRGNTSL